MDDTKDAAGSSAVEIDVYFFLQPSTADPSPTVSTQLIDAFSAAVHGLLDPLPHPSNNSTATASSAAEQRIATRPYRSADGTPRHLPTLRQTAAFRSFEAAHSLEIVLLPRSAGVPPADRPLALAVFDMDSTLIRQEVIDELAALIGQGAAVSAITERAMRGELDFAQSLEARVRLLAGVPAETVWEQVKGRVQFAEGARELCAALGRKGVRMAVLSGGFQPMADWVRAELGLDVAVANHLQTSSSPTTQYPYAHLTGHLLPDKPIVTASRKREILLSLAASHQTPLSQVLCVGDGSNDLEMLNAVGEGGGLGVAFKAKPKVQREAPNRLNQGSLASLLFFFGGDGGGVGGERGEGREVRDEGQERRVQWKADKKAE